MPNFCDNVVTFSHEDPEMIQRVIKGYTGEGLMGEFFPIPDRLVNTMAGSYGADDPRQVELEQREQENLRDFGYRNWYDWCVAEWGTKWDVNSENNGEPSLEDEGRTVQFSFMSAWSPPIGFYERMEELGFAVEAFYYEPGMAFCGRYADGANEEYDLSGLSSDEVEQQIPRDIDEMFAIVENMSAWESEQEMEQANDMPSNKEEG